MKPDKTLSFRSWRQDFDAGCYAFDLDFVEVRRRDGEMTAVAVLELTVAWSEQLDPTNGEESSGRGWYKAFTLGRLERFQRDRILDAAKRLECPAYLVMYDDELQHFWLYNLDRRESSWKYFSHDEYESWTRAL